jgi:hypothetical protein
MKKQMALALYTILVLLLTNCQTRSIPKTSSFEEEIRTLKIQLSKCEEETKKSKEDSIRQLIRDEIIPEVRELKAEGQITSKSPSKKIHPGEKIIIGRVEWIETEDGKARFKARVDTGAQTNSLHAFNIKEKSINNKDYVEFETVDSDNKIASFVEPVIKKSLVKSTSGEMDARYVIEMSFRLGGRIIKTNVNLNDRATLKHKFLIGRNLLIGDYLVDVSQSRLLGGKK